MDPLSMTASIITIIDLITTVVHYLKNSESATEDHKRLLSEAGQLNDLLDSLRFRVETAWSSDPCFDRVRSLARPQGLLDQLKSDLETVNKKLSPRKIRKSGMIPHLSKPIKSEAEIEKAWRRLERVKSDIQLALNMDNIALSRGIREDIASLNGKMEQLCDYTAKMQTMTEITQEQADATIRDTTREGLGSIEHRVEGHSLDGTDPEIAGAAVSTTELLRRIQEEQKAYEASRRLSEALTSLLHQRVRGRQHLREGLESLLLDSPHYTVMPRSSHLTNSIGTQCEYQEIITRHQPRFSTASVGIKDTMVFQASLRLRYCDKSCLCSCHLRYDVESPKSLVGLIGLLQIKNLPFFTAECSVFNCRKAPQHELHIRYCFPKWLVTQVILITLGPTRVLRVLRPVPDRSDIFHAASCGDMQTLKMILDEDALHIRDVQASNGGSMLHTAIRMSRYQTCEFLVERHADVLQPDDFGVSPVIMACEKYFIEPDPVTKEAMRKIISKGNATLMEAYYHEELDFTKIHRLVAEGNSVGLKNELQHSNCDIDSVDVLGNTPLMWAMKTSEDSCANVLLDNGANPNICDMHHRSPLHYAARCRQLNVIRSLLRHKAHLDQRSRWGSSVLHFAVVQGDNDPAFAQALLGRTSTLAVDVTNDDGRSPLFEAVKYDYEKIAEALIEHGADINHRSARDETPIMEAVIHSSEKCVSMLLEKKADCAGVTTRQNTILHLAALCSNIATIELLLEHANLGCVDKEARNVDGKTAISIAEDRAEGTSLSEAFKRLLRKVESERSGYKPADASDDLDDELRQRKSCSKAE